MNNHRTRLASLATVTLALVAGSLAMSAAPAQAFTEGTSTVTAVGAQPEAAVRAVGQVFVANHVGRSLSILDAETLTVVDTVSGLGAPMSVAVAGVPPLMRYIVASTDPPSLEVVSGLSIVGSIPLPGTFPVQALVLPSAENVWFAVDAMGSVIRQEGLAGATTPLVLGGNPRSAVFNAAGNTIYVMDTQGRLIAVDPATMTILREYLIGGGNLTGVAVYGDRAYLSSSEGIVYKVNLVTGAVRSFTLGPAYTGIQVYWYGKYLYLTGRDTRALDIISASTGLLVNSLPLPEEPYRIVAPVQDDQRDVFVVNRTSSVAKIQVKPDPPGRPNGWVSKSCTLAGGRVTARLAWNPPSSPGDLVLEGYSFQLKRASGTWANAQYTRRVETTGTLTTRGYGVGDRISLRVRSLSLAGSSRWLRGTCVVTR